MLMLLRGTWRVRLPVRTATSNRWPRFRIDNPRISGARQYSAMSPPSSRTGPENWLGLGLPLVWWVAAGYGVTSLAVGTYYLTSTDWDALARRAGTGAWGPKTHLAALEELSEMISLANAGESVELVPALVKVGGLRAVSSGVRSADPDVRTAAWNLAAEICSAGPRDVQALLEHDKATHTPTTGEEGTGNVGLFEILAKELAELVYEGTSPQSRLSTGSGDTRHLGNNGQLNSQNMSQFGELSSILGSGTAVGGTLVPGSTAMALDVGALLPRLAVLAAFLAPPLGRLGYRAAFADGLTPAEATQYAESSGISGRCSDPSAQIARGGRSGGSSGGTQWPSAAPSPAAEAGCEVGDPRIVWALVELLAQLNPEFQVGDDSHFPLGSNLSSAHGSSSSSAVHRHPGAAAGPAAGSAGSWPPTMPGSSNGGGGAGGARMLRQVYADGGLDDFDVLQLMGMLEGMLVESLHHLAVGDPTDKTCTLLAAKKPLALLHHLAWAEEDELFVPATLALHRVLDRLDCLDASDWLSGRRDGSGSEGGAFAGVGVGEEGARENSNNNSNSQEGSDEADFSHAVVSSPTPMAPTSMTAALDCMAQLWVPLTMGERTSASNSSSGRAGTSKTSKAAAEASDGVPWAEKLELDTPALSGWDASISLNSQLQLSAASSAALLTLVYAPLRRWWRWRRDGEGLILEEFRKRFAGVAAGATEAVAPFSLRSVLLRSASTNAMGAFVLSTLYGVHGLRGELWRRLHWAHDPDRSTAFHVSMGAARAAGDAIVFGAVLRAAPFCVFPAVIVALAY